MINKKEIKIVGAGISGLTAAIVLAKHGYKVRVFEQFDEVGKRFNEDWQGIENWSYNEDALNLLKRIGIKINFLCEPTYQIDCYGPTLKKVTIHSNKPLYYLVKRGSSDECLDQELKKQALEVGVNIIFNKKVENFEGDIIAVGPLKDSYLEGIAIGYVFKTDIEDLNSVIINDDYAPGAYSYFLVKNKWATLASYVWRDLRNVNKYLERSLNFFKKEYKFRVENLKRMGGTANFFLQDSAKRGHKLFVGEAAGFQDFFLGFGMRYAFLSGYLAGKSIIEKKDYNRLWKNEFKGRLKASVINRFLRTYFGNFIVDSFLHRLERSNSPRELAKRLYLPSVSKNIIFPAMKCTYRKYLKNYIY